MTLNEQRIVVIGGSSGMGLATAQAAARDGAAVTVVSSRPERVDAALAELPDGCDGAVLDVRDEHAVAALFDRVGELDHLVFTAGDAFTPRRLTEMSSAEARAVLDVRFWGAVEVIRSAAPRIRMGGSIALDDRNGRAAASARSCAGGRRGRRRRGPGARTGGRARPGARQRGARRRHPYAALGRGSRASARGRLRPPGPAHLARHDRGAGADCPGPPLPDAEPLCHRDSAHHRRRPVTGRLTVGQNSSTMEQATGATAPRHKSRRSVITHRCQERVLGRFC